MALKQNNLEEATTELGFPKETGIPLQREVELEDGTEVIVEGVTPSKLANDLGVTFRTPGEPYITSDGTTLNGVVQTYNEGSEPKFDDIVLGGSYKFKLKEKLDSIDSMTLEELAEFFNDKDNRVAISDAEPSSTTGNGILTSFIEEQGMIAIAALFIKDSEQYRLMYVPKYMAETEGSGLTPGWVSVEGFTPVTPEIFTMNNVVTLMNNYTGNVSKPGDEISEYGSLKLNWLLDSVESIS